jgi:hypothetical protein
MITINVPITLYMKTRTQHREWMDRNFTKFHEGDALLYESGVYVIIPLTFEDDQDAALYVLKFM